MENLEIYDNVKEKKYDLIKESPKITGYASPSSSGTYDR